MPYQTQHLDRHDLDVRELRQRIERLLNFDAPRYRRLWSYYRNPMLPATVEVETHGADRPYRQAQEWGLPPRITGVVRASVEMSDAQPVEGVARKEVVIENDIAWRIETQIDFLFGKPIVIRSMAKDASRREVIEKLVRAIVEHNGGVTFLQQLALMGAVYGFADVLVKFQRPEFKKEPSPRPSPAGAGEGEIPAEHPKSDDDEPSSDGSGPSAGPGDAPAGSLPPHAEPAPGAAAADRLPPPTAGETDGAAGARTTSHDDDALAHIARFVRLEIVEPARALPLLSPTDWREVEAYVQVYHVPGKSAPLRVAAKRSALRRFLDRFAATRRGALFSSDSGDDQILITEILTARTWQRYEDETLVVHGNNSLGILPLVHIQNSAIPFEYAGASDVESLIPLQDELNTRLCDRAHRITMQSFKMYLGIGIDNFNQLPVAPGRMWMSDNDQAKVIEFGGDTAAPSEDRHIQELREAMDKTSSVTPIAAGVVRGRIGHLTSAAALRVTLAALLAKTARKRITYGEGIARMCELALAWLDRAGLFPTHPDERKFAIHWPSPLPENEMELLQVERLKRELSLSPEGRGSG